MNECAGVVIRVEGDDAWVRPELAGKACGACQQREQGCHIQGATLLDAMTDSPAALLKLTNTIQAQVGDRVVVTVADGMVLRAVWLAYGLPLLLAVVITAGVLALTQSEVFAVLGTVFGLAAGFYWLRQRRFEISRTEPIFTISFKPNPIFFREV
jgi:sigma-E factor negative regulatory protein RseC